MTPELKLDSWLAFLIQYVGLGAVFWFGIFVAIRQGELGLRNRRQRRWLGALVGGFVLYAAIQGFFQFFGPTL